MYNDLFSIGPLSFHTYGLMTGIGIAAAWMAAETSARKKGLPSERIFPLVLWCLLFGYAGSKLLYALTILPELLRDPAGFLRSFSGGWVIFGGLLGGILGGWLYCRRYRLPAWRFFDMGMPCVALAQGFGRIGCFFAGCCYGVETDSLFSVVFTRSDFAPNHVHLVPTQLISAAGDFALCALLLLCGRRQRRDGIVTALYLILYSGGRILVEFWRGDLERGFLGPLSTSQFIGLFTLAAGFILLAIRKGRPAEG